MAHYGQRRASSLLELEAAEFFRIDLSQMDFGINKPTLHPARRDFASNRSRSGSSSSSSSSDSNDAMRHHCAMPNKCQHSRAPIDDSVDRLKPRATAARRELGACASSKHQEMMPRLAPSAAHRALHTHEVRSADRPIERSPPAARRTPAPAGSLKHSPSRHAFRERRDFGACSSASSTNSLPSVSSSPSVSPSLVCPHLSLDDILAFRQQPSGSPHTVGLCSRCRLDPPPNIHSPLSPHFRPHHLCAHPSGPAAKSPPACTLCPDEPAGPRQRRHQNQDQNQHQNRHQQRSQRPVQPGQMRRVHSDHQASCQEAARKRRLRGGELAMPARQKSDLSRARDDSLDYCLAPAELKRMQMSPSLRNSVEFIRRNSIESGRVVRVHKNGQPFEKPLRVCILRDEFSSLNHLLDHINSRLLVPNGARFLFHLDGQPVYSVHELKHGSVYVVSGVRHYDYRTSEVLKMRLEREQQARADKLARQEQQEGGASRARQNRGRIRDKQTAAAAAPAPSRARGVLDDAAGTDACTPSERRQATAAGGSGAGASAADAGSSSGGSGSGGGGGLVRANKFSRYDDSTSMSSSGGGGGGGCLNSSTQSVAGARDEPLAPARPTRAKSELSALPARKPKKNVTFMDTGRGSSPPAGSVGDRSKTDKQAAEMGDWRPEGGPLSGSRGANLEGGSRDLSTSEIGIQVSDSIDGFLIDLPVALPAKGDDSNLARPRNRGRAGSGRAGGVGGQARRTRQIVTITERQLSLEEMNELRDLSAGDHHNEVKVERDEALANVPEAEPEPDVGPEPELEMVPDRSNTIAIGADPHPPRQSDAEQPSETQETPAASAWQYPGGRAGGGGGGGEKSATPTERPVSQSGPSATVRARVTTPTPSLSTTGDNNSLAMSYETVAASDATTGGGHRQPAERLRATPSELPAKERAEVTGKLVGGLDEPARNFRLAWVNGFAINDLYPENTYNAAQEWAGERPSGASSPSARLAPGGPAGTGAGTGADSSAPSARQQQVGANSFKPSERYHNWICHSRKHDELIYPAGTLIVLWCRWTNEQRYYARHTSNVSALALATLDLDLAASAQSCDLNERPPVASKVHLWSLTSLNTLHVVQNDQFRSKLIFSLRLRSTRSAGCELSIAARDEKQLLLFEWNKRPTGPAAASASATSSAGPEQARTANTGDVMMRATKALQSSQLPLFLLRVPNLSNGHATPAGRHALASGEPTISFGRRHFHVWSSDPGQAKLRPMQAEQKGVQFAELMSRANCLCRLSPGEFLLGDSEGNVALLLLDCQANRATGAPGESGAGQSKGKRAVARTPITGPDASCKYSLEVVGLLGPLAASQGSSGRAAPAQAQAAITCLVRVTGSLFMSADATCTLRFWRIKRAPRARERQNSVPTVRLASSSSASAELRQIISCEQLSSISLPPDLGFVCALIMAQYNLRESLVEFYVISTSNTILFGSVKLPSQYVRRSSGADGAARERPPMKQADLLANSSLSVVYEGHETSASGLVADFRPIGRELADECRYFTCSLDCRVCKWQGRQLAWKSLLPSACASLAVHPTGSVLAVGSLDGTVYILDKQSGLLISYFPLTPVRINCLAYSSDGSLLAAACANGSIFMLPVYEQGLKYKKVSIFQSPYPVVSLQFSLDNRYMLTSVTHGPYQELILWDLPNFRYMRDNVKLAADKIRWFDSICSGSEDVRAIWENANMGAGYPAPGDSQLEGDTRRAGHKRPGQAAVAAAAAAAAPGGRRAEPAATKRDPFIVNLSCHRLIKADAPSGASQRPEDEQSFVVASDTRGYLRLFRYPCYDIQQGFYAVRISSSAVNCCRFLHSGAHSHDQFVSTSLDGSICLWAIE